MTLDDVRRATAALEAQGLTPSANKILQHLGVGSKHTVLKFMRQLAPAPAPVPVVPPVAASAVEPWKRPYRPPAAPPAAAVPNGHAPPVPTDPTPLPRALAAVEAAEVALDAARADMQHAACGLALAKGLIHENQRLCNLEPQDPAATAAVAYAAETTGTYRRAWGAYVDAHAALAAAQGQHQRQQQARWVAQHAPDLKQALDAAYEAVRLAPNDRMHYTAKLDLQKVQFEYQRALAEAPVNGTEA
jgi:hypothetical protein